MLRIGHRGAAGLAPENTLSAIREALKHKVDMIELDVRTCKTGEVVLFHDKTVNRLTEGVGAVKELTLEEIQRLRIGQEKIPTLDEALKHIRGQVPVNIEMKDAASVDEIARLIQKHGLSDCIISSADRPGLLRLKKIRPDTTIGIVSLGLNPFLLSWAAKRDIYSVSVLYPFIRRSFVDRCRAKNIKVFVYPYGSKIKLNTERLRKFGIDGIFYNYPEKKPF